MSQTNVVFCNSRIQGEDMASKINLSSRSKMVVILLFIHCLLLLSLFVADYLVSLSFLVCRSSRWGKESLLLDFCCVLNVISLLSFFDSSLWCHGLV